MAKRLNPIIQKFSENLAKRRAHLGISQAELAERMKTSQPKVCNMERGYTDVRLTTIYRLAKVLKVSPKYFLK